MSLPQKEQTILHILTSGSRGGLELYATELMVRQRQAGLNISAILCLNSPSGDTLKGLGIPVHFLPNGSRYSLLRILRARKIFRQERPDIIHTHTNKDMWLAVLGSFFRHYKIILSLYIGAGDKRDFIHKLIFRRVSFVVSSSENTNREIQERYPIEKSKVKLLRYGRDAGQYSLSIFKRLQIRREFHIPGGYLVAGTMSRIDKMKGVMEFVQAISLLPEKAKIHFYVFGDRTIDGFDSNGMPMYDKNSDKYFSEILRFIDQKNLKQRVTLIPFRKDYIPILLSMDIFILPSYDEMYSLSVIEAMLGGLPVIGTNRGGTPEQILHGKTGYLIEPQNSTEIAYALQKYLANPNLITRHGEAGKKLARQEHNWEKVMTGYMNIYKEALG